MALPNTFASFVYTEVSYTNNATSYAQSAIDTARMTNTIAAITTLVGTQDQSDGSTDAAFTRIAEVSEIPDIGDAANIVNVPVFGQASSSQVSAQADSPQLDFVLLYNPSVHSVIEGLNKDGIVRVFRVRMAAVELPSTVVATTEHADFYVIGSLVGVNRSNPLTDAGRLTITITKQGDFIGPLTTV